MVQRLTYRRRHSYCTISNVTRKVRTPGGKLAYQYVSKTRNGPACGDCGARLHGIPALSPKAYRTIKKRERKVARAYGGSRCSTCVRHRIIRAFLVEEQKIVKKVLRQRAHTQKPAAATKS